MQSGNGIPSHEVTCGRKHLRAPSCWLGSGMRMSERWNHCMSTITKAQLFCGEPYLAQNGLALYYVETLVFAIGKAIHTSCCTVFRFMKLTLNTPLQAGSGSHLLLMANSTAKWPLLGKLSCTSMEVAVTASQQDHLLQPG